MGPTGAVGPTGPQGPAGPTSPSTLYIGKLAVPGGSPGTLSLPPNGFYWVQANLFFHLPTVASGVQCIMTVNGQTVSQAYIGEPDSYTAIGTPDRALTFGVPVDTTTATSNVSVAVDCFGREIFYGSSFVALQVGAIASSS